MNMHIYTHMHVCVCVCVRKNRVRARRGRGHDSGGDEEGRSKEGCGVRVASVVHVHPDVAAPRFGIKGWVWGLELGLGVESFGSR